jgi:hypothetical protein
LRKEEVTAGRRMMARADEPMNKLGKLVEEDTNEVGKPLGEAHQSFQREMFPVLFRVTWFPKNWMQSPSLQMKF